MTNELLTPPEAMARLKCSRSTLYRLGASGALRFIPGKPVKFLAADVDLYIIQQLVRKTPRPADPASTTPVADQKRVTTSCRAYQSLRELYVIPS
jgi:excisionase family DNA binding protein